MCQNVVICPIWAGAWLFIMSLAVLLSLHEQVPACAETPPAQPQATSAPNASVPLPKAGPPSLAQPTLQR